MSTRLLYAITLIKTGDIQQGRQLLVELLQTEPQNEAAWLWMSNVVSTDEQRLHCLNQVLSINPQNQLALQGLAELQQKGRAERTGPAREIALPPPEPQAAAQSAPNAKFPPLASPPPSATPAGLTSTDPSSEPHVSTNLHLYSLIPPTPAASVDAALLPAEKIQPDFQPVKPGSDWSDTPPRESQRIWIHPKSSSHRVLMLYSDGIAVVANPDKATLLQLAASQEPPARERFGRKLTWLSAHEITSVEAISGANRLQVRFTQNNKPALRRIPLANAKALDEFMKAIQTGWRANFERTLKPYSPLAAMIIPLIAFGLVILLTYFLYGAAVDVAAGNGPETTGRRVLLPYLVLGLTTLLGPTGVLIVGVVLAALTLFWMFASMLNPPTRTVLTPIKK